MANQETKDTKDQVTNTQVPMMKLPGRAHPQIGVPIAARNAVDVEAVRTEVANADEPADGRPDGGPVPIFLKDTLIACLKVCQNIISNFGWRSAPYEFFWNAMSFRPRL